MTLDEATDKLGMNAEEIASGMKGMIVHVSEVINGCVRLGIQPKGDGKEYPQSYLFDTIRINILDAGISTEVGRMKTPTFQIEDRVQDIVTGFAGIVTERVFHLNGCITYKVESKMIVTQLGEMTKFEDLEQDRLVLSDKKAKGKKAKAKATKEPKAKKTFTGGAPSMGRFR